MKKSIMMKAVSVLRDHMKGLYHFSNYILFSYLLYINYHFIIYCHLFYINCINCITIISK